MLRILCNVSSTRGARLLAHLHSYGQGRVHVVLSDAPTSALAREIDRMMPDVVLYDPVIDEGALLRDGCVGGVGVPAVICLSDDPAYALMAFQLGAVHYLTYDATDVELDCALDRCRGAQPAYHAMIARDRSAPFVAAHAVIALPVFSGIELRDQQTIIRIQGEGNYTRVIFVSEPPIILSRTIRDYAPVLEHGGFLRVHRSHMVNIVHVRRILRGKTPRLLMCNGDEVDVSNTYREQLYAAVRMVERRAS